MGSTLKPSAATGAEGSINIIQYKTYNNYNPSVSLFDNKRGGWDSKETIYLNDSASNITFEVTGRINLWELSNAGYVGNNKPATIYKLDKETGSYSIPIEVDNARVNNWVKIATLGSGTYQYKSVYRIIDEWYIEALFYDVQVIYEKDGETTIAQEDSLEVDSEPKTYYPQEIEGYRAVPASFTYIPGETEDSIIKFTYYKIYRFITYNNYKYLTEHCYNDSTIRVIPKIIKFDSLQSSSTRLTVQNTVNNVLGITEMNASISDGQYFYNVPVRYNINNNSFEITAPQSNASYSGYITYKYITKEDE